MKSFKTFLREFEQSWEDQATNAFHASIHGSDNIQMRNFSEAYSRSDDMHKLHDELSHRHDFGIADSHNLHDYTENSRFLNEHLWDSHRDKEPIHSSYKHQVNGMDKALSRYKLTSPMTVWSSTRHDPRVKKNENGILHHPAYMSTSLDRKVATNRQINAHQDENGDEHHHILKLDLSEGQRGAYVGHISRFKSEKEFILPRGMNFKYHKTETHSESHPNPYSLTDEKMKFHTHTHHMTVEPKVSHEIS